ncbi:MAG: glycosyltransferase [Phycisphaerae bacterium]
MPTSRRNPDSRPIRLLIVITDLKVGGTPLDVLRLATSLPRDRFRVLVVPLADVGPVGERLQAAGIPVAPCNARSARDVRALLRLYRTIRAFRPDIVHALLFHANVAARLVAPAAGVPADRIVCSILTVERERLWHLRGETLTCRRCRWIVGNSRSVVDHLHRAAHVPRRRLRLIRGAIDTTTIAAARPIPRRDLGVPEGVPLVLWVGRMDPVKGLDELIQACAMLRERLPIHVLLAGEGTYESAVRRRIAVLGASSFVHRLGRRDDVAALLATADLFAFPSRSEGLPTALMEAMAAGKPIVTTDAPGCRDLIRHGQTGLTVPVGDARALADAMARLLDDADLSRRLGAAAAAWALANCDWPAALRQWIALYEEVHGKGPAFAPSSDRRTGSRDH